MNKKIGVFIPARLSSQRLPNKQILPIDDSCMFDIACKKLNEYPADINKYVLIYEDELIDIASKYKKIKIIKRSEKSSKVDGPLSFIFGDMKNVEDTHLLFLNSCLIFLSKETVIKSIRDFENSNADYGTSVKPLQNWIMNKDGILLNDMDYKTLNTKTIEPLLQTAHCFHIFNRKQFFTDGLMLKEGFMPLPISEEETIDIDTKIEYEFAKWKYENEIRS